MSLYRDRLRDFLYREARLPGRRQWDEWLECTPRSASFWMPAWDDYDTLTEDPHSEISLIYYGNRDGLEDRVFRIKTERSSATTPDTAHLAQLLGNLESARPKRWRAGAAFNWHTLSYRYKTTTAISARFYGLDISGEQPLIKAQESGAEERLHASGHRHLPHLRTPPRGAACLRAMPLP
jgi:benzoate/toluate 1,2-dioxygenase subunit beta